MKLLTSKEWCDQEDVQILDHDGWQTNDIYGEIFKPCDFYVTPISKHEFFKRKLISTCFIKVNIGELE